MENVYTGTFLNPFMKALTSKNKKTCFFIVTKLYYNQCPKYFVIMTVDIVTKQTELSRTKIMKY